MYELKRCVLLADDEERIVRALRDLLSSNGFFVLTALSGREALEQFGRYSEQIDLVLLDVMMPEGDGFSVLREIRAASSLVPVVMLTARGVEYDQLQGLQDGADDYIAKPFSTRILLARIEAVLRRFGRTQLESVAAGGITMVPAQRTAEVDGQRLELTRREFELLYYFLRNQGLTLTREQLLNRVWGYDFEGDERTVDTHVKNLRLKLGRCAGYIRTVYRVGYKFEVAE